MADRNELAAIQEENFSDMERGVSEDVLRDLGYTAFEDFDDVVDQARLHAGRTPGTKTPDIIDQINEALAQDPDKPFYHLPIPPNDFTDEERAHAKSKIAQIRADNADKLKPRS